MLNTLRQWLIIAGWLICAGVIGNILCERGTGSNAAFAQEEQPAADDPAPADLAADPTTPSAAEAEANATANPPLLSEMELPPDAQLLNGPKHDWLVFVSQQDTGPLSADSPIPPDVPDYVLIVEPLYPRPGKLESIRERINERFDSRLFVDRALLDELPYDEGLQLRNLIYEEFDPDELKRQVVERIKTADASTIDQTPPDGEMDLPEMIIDYFRQEAFKSARNRKKKADDPNARDLTELLKGETLKRILVKQIEELPALRYQELEKTVLQLAEDKVAEGMDAAERRELKRQRQDDRRAAAQELRDLRAARLKLMLEERQDLDMVNLVLVDGGETPEVKIRIRYVKDIIYHEDLMLRRVDQLIQEQKLGFAFEMLYVLEKQSPQWPGLTRRKSDLILAEAVAKRNENDPINALVLVEEAYRLDAQANGLKEQAGLIAEDLIQAANADNDERRARHYHRRLRDLYPDHEVVIRWETEWSSQASALIQQAQAAFSEGRYAEATELVRLASRVWPQEPSLASAYRKIVQRSQRLEVGVLRRHDSESQFPWRTIVQERHRRLLEVDLFEVKDVRKQTHYASRFFERWEPTNLGREAEFWLRRSRRDAESLPMISAKEIADELQRRIDVNSPAYDERLASYLKSVTVKTPYQLSVDFSRIPFQSEALFRFPVVTEPSSAIAHLSVPTGAATATAVAQADPSVEREAAAQTQNASTAPIGQRFVLHEITAERALYRRAIPEPDGSEEYHIAEISERRFPTSKQLMQALFRGEISMVPQLEKSDVAALQKDERFVVGTHGLPVTHLIQFHPDSEPMQNVQVRRALAYGINREKILQETILKGGDSAWGRLISAPYSSLHDAYSKLLSTRPYDLTMSLSLLFSAKRQFPDGMPVLKMACEPDAQIRAAAEQIARGWSRMGIEVELLPMEVDLSKPPADGSPPWDIAYRTAVVEDPILDLWPMICQEPHASVASLSFLPDWLRQEFIELENANDFKTAIRWMHRLHEHLQNEAVVIPLWETDEFYLYRKNIAGVPLQPMWSYQDVEFWSLTPWYSTELP